MGNTFLKDGAITKFCEGVPIVEHGVAAIHAMNGNMDKAKRAALTSSGPLAGPVVGLLIGTMQDPLKHESKGTGSRVPS
jgi:hypothetical protein